eukprot:2677845-Lingulodinium_polyedra.AAC.1
MTGPPLGTSAARRTHSPGERHTYFYDRRGRGGGGKGRGFNRSPDETSRLFDPDATRHWDWHPSETLHRGITRIVFHCPACHFNNPDVDQDAYPSLRIDPFTREVAG